MTKNNILNMNIRNKLLIVMLISVIVPFLAFGAILFSVGNHEIKNKVTHSLIQTISQLSTTFTQYISRTDQSNRMIDNNISIPIWLRNEVTQLETDRRDTLSIEQAALCALEEFALTNSDIHSLSAITMSGKRITYVEQKFDRSCSDFFSSYYEPLRNSTGNTVLLPVKISENAFSPSVPVFTVGYKHLDITTDESNGINTYTGYILSECPTNILAEFCNGIDLGTESRLYILDNMGTLAYTTSEDPTENETVLNLLKDNNTDEEIYIGHERYYLIQCPLADTGWLVYGVIPYRLLIENFSNLKYTFTILSLVMIIIIFFIAWIESKYFTKPIFQMCDSMKCVADGDLTVRFTEKRSDEFGQLRDGFNTLIERVDTLITDVSEIEAREAIAKYRMLQNQINPHFLYNTLDTIRMMAILEDEDTIAEALLNLSKLFRYNVKNDNKLVTLEEEVEQIRNYLHLQKLRFGDRIEVFYEIDPASLRCQMPKMLLQPLVENVFAHGFKDLEQDGIITLKSVIKNNTLYVSVMDNGSGISEEKLTELTSVLEKKTSARIDSIGLINVNERLRLYYSDAHILHVESQEGKGTAVSFSIPLNEKITALYKYETKEGSL